VGGVTSYAVLVRRTPLTTELRATIFVTAALWLRMMPAAGPTLDTHTIVTRVALKLSGHERPYTRGDLLRAH
jgi:hypothetical protein